MNLSYAAKNQLSIGVGQTEIFICGLGPVRLLDVDNTSVTLPADTAIHVVHTFTIPAKLLNANGVADIYAWFDTGGWETWRVSLILCKRTVRNIYRTRCRNLGRYVGFVDHENKEYLRKPVEYADGVAGRCGQ